MKQVDNREVLYRIKEEKERFIEEYYDNYVWVHENNTATTHPKAYTDPDTGEFISDGGLGVLQKSGSQDVARPVFTEVSGGIMRFCPKESVPIKNGYIMSKEVFGEVMFDWVDWDVGTMQDVKNGKKMVKYGYEEVRGGHKESEGVWSVPFVLGDGKIFVNEEVEEWDIDKLVHFGVMMRANKYGIDGFGSNMNLLGIWENILIQWWYGYGLLGSGVRRREMDNNYYIMVGELKKRRNLKNSCIMGRDFDLEEYRVLVVYCTRGDYVNRRTLKQGSTVSLRIREEEVEGVTYRYLITRTGWMDNWIINNGDHILVKTDEVKESSNNYLVYKEYEKEDRIDVVVAEFMVKD